MEVSMGNRLNFRTKMFDKSLYVHNEYNGINAGKGKFDSDFIASIFQAHIDTMVTKTDTAVRMPQYTFTTNAFRKNKKINNGAIK
jgi:hypothetical protein